MESVERLLAHVPGLAKFERAQLGLSYIYATEGGLGARSTLD